MIQSLPRRLGGEGVVRLLRDVTGCVVVVVLAVGSPTLQVLLLSSLWDVVALLLEHGVCVHLVGNRIVSNKLNLVIFLFRFGSYAPCPVGPISSSSLCQLPRCPQ